jgi:hemerythrin
MAVFVWNKKFSVGMERIDDQHKHFLDLLNNLDDKIQQQNNEKTVETAIDRLFDYATLHFRAEERILHARGYSEFEQQCQEHSLFLTRLNELAASNQGGNRLHKGSVVSFVRDWFIQHITIEDQKYASVI